MARKRSVESLADPRLVHLSKLGPRGWYIDHARRVPTDCNCSLEGPVRGCDVGEALFHLRAAEVARHSKA